MGFVFGSVGFYGDLDFISLVVQLGVHIVVDVFMYDIIYISS